jgi:hypothetical protein
MKIMIKLFLSHKDIPFFQLLFTLKLVYKDLVLKKKNCLIKKTSVMATVSYKAFFNSDAMVQKIQ